MGHLRHQDCDEGTPGKPTAEPSQVLVLEGLRQGDRLLDLHSRLCTRNPGGRPGPEGKLFYGEYPIPVHRPSRR